MPRLQEPVHVIVPRQQRCPYSVLQVVAPHLGVPMEPVWHRGVAALELPAVRLAIPELGVVSDQSANISCLIGF